MTIQIVQLGATSNDGEGDPLRLAFGKTNSNAYAVYTAFGNGQDLSSATTFVQSTWSAATASAFRAAIGAGTGTGSVVSVAMTVPSFLSVSGSPITDSGTFVVTTVAQSANLMFAGPSSGASASPTFRALTSNDLPANLTGYTGSGGTFSGPTIVNATISGGSYSGITVVNSTFSGGTVSGASIRGGTISGASASNLTLSGGTANGMAIGQTTRASGSFTVVNATTYEQVGGATTSNNFVQRRIVEIPTVTAYSTVLTIAPSGSGGSFTRGRVAVTVAGSTGGVGNGLCIGDWYIDVSNGNPTVSTIQATVSSGVGSPLFQLATSGLQVFCQVQSANGTGSFGGFATFDLYLPKPEGTTRTWSIT